MSIASLYLKLIRDYQQAHGFGTKPRKVDNPALSNWFNDRVRTYRQRVQADPTFAAPPEIRELASLGLFSLDPESPHYVLPSPDPDRPKGLHQSATALIERYQAGRPPTLLSPLVADRHLAVWNVRIHAGILAANQVSSAHDSEKLRLIDQVKASYAEVSTPMQLAIEWILFCARVGRLTRSHVIKPDTWHSRVSGPAHLTLMSDSFHLPLHHDLPSIMQACHAGATLTSCRLYQPSEVLPYVNALIRPTNRFSTFSPDPASLHAFELLLSRSGASFVSLPQPVQRQFQRQPFEPMARVA